MKPWTDKTQSETPEVIPEVDEQPTEISDDQPGVSEVIPETIPEVDEEPTDDPANRKTLKWSDQPKDDQSTEISDNQDEQESEKKEKKTRREIMMEQMKARLSKKKDDYRDDDGNSKDARVSSALWRISSTEKWDKFITAGYFKIK